MALGYCRSFSALISGDAYECPWDNWKVRTAKPKIVKGELEDLQMIRVHLDFLQQAEAIWCDFNTLATGTAAAMRYCHWTETHTSNPAPRHIAPKLAASILSEHLQDTGRVLSAPALHMLVESTAHYLTPLWIRERRDNPRSLLTLQLAKVYLASHAIAPDTAGAAAVALAAAAFLADSYPGGESPLPSPKDREKRAVQVLRYYRINKPTNRTMSSLFAFGFTGLLSSLDFKSLGPEVALMPTLLAAAAGYIAQDVRSGGEVDIYTLPPSLPLADYLTLSACRSLLSVAHYNFDHAHELAIEGIYTNFMLPNLDIACADNRLYTAALKALCYAQSNDLHDLCLTILDAQPVPVRMSRPLVDALRDHNILERLCDTSLSSMVMPIISAAAALHLKLLIATIILSTEYPLEDRQSLLRPIIRCRHEFAGLKASALDHGLPGNESLLLHIRQSSLGELGIQQTMLRTMQYAVDFCHVDPKLNPLASTNSSGESSTSGWRAKLQEIKGTHRLSSVGLTSTVESSNFGPMSIASQSAEPPRYTDVQLSNQMGWPNQTERSNQTEGALNDSQPTPQFTPNAEAPRAGLQNANPLYTNYADPSPQYPTQTPDRLGASYVGLPEPYHYQPGPRPAASSEDPQAPHPLAEYPHLMQPQHSDLHEVPSACQLMPNSVPYVPAPWQQSNRPGNDCLPGHTAMPCAEHYSARCSDNRG
ncbi:hypothetical protein FS749_002098 [Ceratobasidium sp. UAMH 11750]|nr:hypothetical protein FS749_002098 [Ceratobasidium sp. UAMH 11750]